MQIRLETAADAGTIRQLTQQAFAEAEHRSGTEAEIIDMLRQDGQLSLSLVAEAEADGQAELVGHVAFSPVSIGGQACGWFGLGPVSVRPDRQGQGIGTRLIRDGLQHLRAQAATGCVVLGDPAYYQRFGFAVDPELHLEGVLPEYFMAQVLQGPAGRGLVRYHAAFGAGLDG